MQHEGDGDTHWGSYTMNNPQSIAKEAKIFGNKRIRRDNPDYSIKIGQNTEKSPGDFRIFTVNQTSVRIS